jgi:Arc/MetJ-type ribon-helix-helix transcriptional regulator
MTAAKIAITLPRPLLAKVRGAVKSGRAGSVSAFVTQALEQRVREDSLQSLVSDLIAEHGEPSKEDKAWAKRVLARKRK